MTTVASSRHRATLKPPDDAVMRHFIRLSGPGNRTRGPGTARGGHTRSSSGTSRAVARLLSAFTDPGFTPRSMAER